VLPDHASEINAVRRTRMVIRAFLSSKQILTFRVRGSVHLQSLK